MEKLLPLVIILPFVGSALIGLGGLISKSFRKQEKVIGAFATLMVFIPFLIILSAFLQFSGKPYHFELFKWVAVGDFEVSFAYTLDQLSLLMGMIVTGVGSVIHLYSIGYMHGDSGFYKYFAYLNLFIFSMNNLILGDNMLVTFLGWEGVGACSYLLIGFWFTDMMKAKAAQKAFVVNRIGDFAFLIAMFMIYVNVGSLKYDAILSANLDLGVAFWVALLVFIASTGKSAQIPLYVWLPDAMAGPTPVSALIHAATMVTSGIYVIARLSKIYVLVPEVMMIVTAVAALTAIVAASIAIAQNDIKKVLAYSTVSQLGYMFMALGAGAFSTAIFHVMTHAFFKACLFLGSGSVIHAMEHTHAVEDPQDIRTMGGLRKYMPSTAKTFWIATLAIAGIPPFAGFFSKDEILANTFARGHEYTIYYLFWGVGVVTALLTAFYMTRLSVLTFEGKPRFDAEKHPPHESPAVMTIPLWILAILSIVGGFVGIPAVIGHGEYHWISKWLSILADQTAHLSLGTEITLMLLSIIIAVFGVMTAWKLYTKYVLEADVMLQNKLGNFYNVLANKYYVDEIYDKYVVKPFLWVADKVVLGFDKYVIDGIVDGTGVVAQLFGEVGRALQTGLVRDYALYIWIGAALLLSYLLWF